MLVVEGEGGDGGGMGGGIARGGEDAGLEGSAEGVEGGDAADAVRTGGHLPFLTEDVNVKLKVEG